MKVLFVGDFIVETVLDVGTGQRKTFRPRKYSSRTYLSFSYIFVVRNIYSFRFNELNAIYITV